MSPVIQLKSNPISGEVGNILKKSSKRGSPDREVGERMRDILHASASLFAELGYKGTTVDSVAEKLNINKATIYHYFGSKSDILFQIIWHIIEESVKFCDRALVIESPIEAIDSMLSDLVNLGNSDRDFFRVYFQENSFFEQHLPNDLFQMIRANERRITKTVYIVLKKGAETGELVECNVKYVGRLTMALALAPYRWREAALDVDQVMDSIRLICFQGIKARS